MKDKRQKLAFAWPGYPPNPFSYFSYMYAAATTGYISPQSNVNQIASAINSLPTGIVQLTPTKIRSMLTSRILNGSVDTVTSTSSASSPTSSSSSPKQNHQQHSPTKPAINFTLPAMGLATFLPNTVNEAITKGHTQ